MVLFILKNGTQEEFLRVINYSKKEDKVILIQNAILVLQEKNSSFLDFIKKNKISIFVLKEDLEIRGIKNVNLSNIVDYEGFLELIEGNKVFS